MAYSRPENELFKLPNCEDSVLPDPSRFFSKHLLSNPLPTNSFFQNFTLSKGDQPEYIHPYLIKPSESSLSISYPSLFHNSDFFYEVFKADIVISGSPTDQSSKKTHQISSFSDLGVNLDFPSSNLRFFLVRGCPFITFSVSSNSITISTSHEFVSFSGNSSCTKHTAKLNNNQTWLIYASSPINLAKQDNSWIHCRGEFSGVIRIAVLPTSNPDFEPALDRFSRSYPVSGEAEFTKPFTLEYKWEKRGHGDLLMLAHPLHLKLLSKDNESITVLDNIKYTSIDGDLTGVVGDSWVLKPDTVPITWHSLKGIKQDSSREEIISALIKDVIALNSSAPVSSWSYHYGKVLARAARLALIAEEVSYLHVIPAISKYLKDMIEPWLDGSFGPNSFVYDPKWGGLITIQGAKNAREDLGYGVYNNHHIHLGYFLYAIAVLVKIDPLWGKSYKPHAYTLLADYMTLGKNCDGFDSVFPRLRCFDFFKLHSWSGGLTVFADGRNQVGPSEAVNAYYSAALLGLAYGDVHLVAVASTIMSLEIHGAKMWWQVNEDNVMYPKDFTAKNRLVGVLWSTKRDSSLWFGDSEWKECRLGQQLLPLIPVSEILFSDVKFVKQLVKWTLPALKRDGVKEGWKGFVYALESVYDKYEALEKSRGLREFDDGNSLSNLLWWVHSRD
ncbi:hypothetical protein N665_0891s0024 [Sinapis alba]|nr:hypothetical protein N665_0891s0024 [Sinapis alba]